jgi:PDZ domain-containing protein
MVAALDSLPSAHVLLLPGETRGVGPMVAIEDDPGRPGGFLMTTIATRPASWGRVLLSWVHPGLEARRVDDLVGADRTVEEYYRLNQVLMQESQALAIVAAWRYLEEPVELSGDGVLVVAVRRWNETPLRSGDVVLAVNQRPVHLASELRGYLAASGAGGVMQLAVRRRDEQLVLTLTLPAAGTGWQLDTATVGLTARGTRQITVDAGEVAGPSAGLAFALEIIDRLLPTVDLSLGGQVAVTGVLDAEGRVLAVGGVRHKAASAERAGARYLVVPAANAEEAARGVRHLRILPVSTVQDAVSRLQALSPP